MSSSLTQLANAAAQDLGVFDSGGALSAQQYLDVLAKANRILDNWNSDQIQIPWALRVTAAVTANTKLYTVGPGQNWVFTSTPRKIVAASHTVNNAGPTVPVEVIDPVKWTSLPDRDVSAYIIKYLYYNRGALGSTIATALISPAPLQNGSMELIAWDALTAFADVSTPITFPPGYELPFQLELATEIALMFSMEPSTTLLNARAEAMNRLRKNNADLWGADSLGPAQQAVDAASQ